MKTGEEFVVPPDDVATRWNSTLLMLNVSLNIRDALNLVLKTVKPSIHCEYTRSFSHIPDFSLADESWNLLDELSDFLQVGFCIFLLLEKLSNCTFLAFL